MTAARTQERSTDALRRALASPFEDDEIRLITLPAPRCGPEHLLRLEAEGTAMYWSPADGLAMAGVGAAALVRGAGPNRAAEVDDAARRLWPRVRTVGTDGMAPLPARLFGGVAFLADCTAPPWDDFGQGTFVLPRLLYEAGDGDGDGGGRLAVAVTANEMRRGGRDAATRLVAEALIALSDAGDPGHAAGRGAARPAVAGTSAEARAEWGRIVESIQRRIETGRAEKIVAARVHELRLRRPLDLAAAVRRLGHSPSEARFAFRFGRTVFLGATPERLVARRGLEVRTEAVAGSIEANGAERDSELRSSLKDDAEHQFVVRAIAGTLAPLCDRLDYPSEPDIARLRHVLHLRTPFAGTLTDPVPILDLVARLHPTPAVGGTPTAEALDWIAHEEPGCRGWYAAPVGWFDGDGDGDFVVALRSALVDGDRALLYAGAGIVRDSDVDAELSETDVKLRTMLDALGADA